METTESKNCTRFDSYPMLRMTHPSRNFFVLFLFFVLWIFIRLRVQGFESSVNKVFQKEKLDNSKTRIYSPQLKGLSCGATKLVHGPFDMYENQ